MACLCRLVNCFFLFLIITQVSVSQSKLLKADSQQGYLNSEEPKKTDLDLSQKYDSSSNLELHPEKRRKMENQNSDEERNQMDYDLEIDYSYDNYINKRNARDRRLNGKSRKYSNHALQPDQYEIKKARAKLIPRVNKMYKGVQQDTNVDVRRHRNKVKVKADDNFLTKNNKKEKLSFYEIDSALKDKIKHESAEVKSTSNLGSVTRTKFKSLHHTKKTESKGGSALNEDTESHKMFNDNQSPKDRGNDKYTQIKKKKKEKGSCFLYESNEKEKPNEVCKNLKEVQPSQISLNTIKKIHKKVDYNDQMNSNKNNGNTSLINNGYQNARDIQYPKSINNVKNNNSILYNNQLSSMVKNFYDFSRTEGLSFNDSNPNDSWHSSRESDKHGKDPGTLGEDVYDQLNHIKENHGLKSGSTNTYIVQDVNKKGLEANKIENQAEHARSQPFRFASQSIQNVHKNINHPRRAKKKHQYKEAIENISEREESLPDTDNTEAEDSKTNVGDNINMLDDYSTDTNHTLNVKRSERGIKKRHNWISGLKSKMKNNEGNFFSVHSDSETLDDSRDVESYKNEENLEKDVGFKMNSQGIDESGKYSYKQSAQDENEPLSEEDNLEPEDSLKLFSRRSHESGLTSSGEQSKKENCPESYKSENTTKQPTVTTTINKERYETTETSYCVSKTTSTVPSSTTCTTKPNDNNQKNRATSKTNNKTLLTKNPPGNSKPNLTSDSDIDIYEQFLCGQLADDFVTAVLSKVKKSRKIYMELGFKNESEETCERCIETKPNKMPSLETMKTALGKCSKTNKQTVSCLTCYNVPKPMDKVLNLLTLYEKEHENSAYNKIRDDSSFIFTGDYPDKLTRNEDLIDVNNNEKYIGERESFDKNTFEKQHLKEENNEEKVDDQIPSKNIIQKSEASTNNEAIKENSTETIEDEKSLGDDEISETKEVHSKEIHDKEYNDKNDVKSSLESDEKLKGSDQEEEFDANSPFSNKYANYEGHEIEVMDEPSFESNSVRRRKAFKATDLQSAKKPFIFSKHAQTSNYGGTVNQQSRIRKFNLNGPNQLKSNHEQGNLYNRQLNVHSGPSRFESTRQKYSNTNIYNNVRPYNKNNKISSLQSVASDKYSNLNNFFNYPSEEYVERNKVHPYENNVRQDQMANDFPNSEWDSNEYELLSNLPRHNSGKQFLNTGIKQYYKKDYGDKLDMVKRDTEPSYEDELLFFEIPDIEYDLY